MFPARIISVVLMVVVANLHAVELTLPDLQGRDRSLSEFRGKWVLVNFWATWCPPCVAEMPELSQFHDRHQSNDAVVVGINMEEIGLSELQRFVDDMLIDYPILLAPVDGHTSLGKVTALPTSVLLDPTGRVVRRFVGVVSMDQLEAIIKGSEQ